MKSTAFLLIQYGLGLKKTKHNIDVRIDFSLSKTMQDLVDEAEKADILNDYGLHMNIANAIDSQGKKETTHHIFKESEWKKLTRRYCLQ